MRTIGDIVSGVLPARPRGNTYRSSARFVRDLAAVSTPLDRNARARLLVQAEAIERRTKGPGQRNGLLGQCGLAVLRALLLQFHNGKSGLCNPSIEKIREVTGFCRQTVVKALRALESIRLLIVTRRLIRQRIERNGVALVTTTQGSNVYGFRLDAVIPIPSLSTSCSTSYPTSQSTSQSTKRPRSFPKPNALIKLLFSSVHGTGTNYKPQA